MGSLVPANFLLNQLPASRRRNSAAVLEAMGICRPPNTCRRIAAAVEQVVVQHDGHAVGRMQIVELDQIAARRDRRGKGRQRVLRCDGAITRWAITANMRGALINWAAGESAAIALDDATRTNRATKSPRHPSARDMRSSPQMAVNRRLAAERGNGKPGPIIAFATGRA